MSGYEWIGIVGDSDLSVSDEVLDPLALSSWRNGRLSRNQECDLASPVG